MESAAWSHSVLDGHVRSFHKAWTGMSSAALQPLGRAIDRGASAYTQRALEATRRRGAHGLRRRGSARRRNGTVLRHLSARG
jgi:hypothetical protein